MPLLPRIGFFNDNSRDAVKGAEVYGHISKGFVSGAPTEDKIAKSLWEVVALSIT
ncbi:MAG: hypothetical protein ACLUSV_04075 [Streptococcus sp.]